MRYLLLLLLAVTSSAVAQPACWPAEVPGAKGTRAVFVQDTAARAVAWGCTDGFRSWAVAFAGPRSAFSSDWLARAHTLLWATDAERAAAWTQLVAIQSIPADVKPAFDRAVGGVVLPPVPTYVVARNSTYTTRPAYPMSNGIRGSVSNGRATVGATCDCALRSIEASSTYCGVTATQVALCVKQ